MITLSLNLLQAKKLLFVFTQYKAIVCQDQTPGYVSRMIQYLKEEISYAERNTPPSNPPPEPSQALPADQRAAPIPMPTPRRERQRQDDIPTDSTPTRISGFFRS